MLHDILDWANLTLMVTGIFFAGVVWNKVNYVLEQLKELQAFSSLEARLGNTTSELNRVRDRLDKLIDASKAD